VIVRRRVAPLRVVVAVAIAVAIAGGASGAGAVRADGPCELLTRREISTALGQPARKTDFDLGPTFCQWRLAATTERAVGQVNTLLERGERAVRDFRVVSEFVDAVPVPGIGKQAYYLPSTGALFVRDRGRTLFNVQVLVYDPDGTRRVDGLQDLVVDLTRRAGARVR
jgi:hypothetical protein